MSYFVLDGARRTIVLASVIALVIGCERPSARVHVERAAVTLDVVGASAAAYFTVRDEGRVADTVVGIQADIARRVSMQIPSPHRVPALGGSAAALMLPVRAILLGRDGRVRFAPGGNTGMLVDLSHTLAVGDSVRLTVTLASGRTATATAPVLPYVDLERALATHITPSPDTTTPSVAEGDALYRANGCASCHGQEGFGDGPVGRTLVPRPRDFRDTLAFRAGRDAESIARMLAVGIVAGGNMPQYAHLTNQERTSLALYVISLRTSSTQRNTLP